MQLFGNWTAELHLYIQQLSNSSGLAIIRAVDSTRMTTPKDHTRNLVEHLVRFTQVNQLHDIQIESSCLHFYSLLQRKNHGNFAHS